MGTIVEQPCQNFFSPGMTGDQESDFEQVNNNRLIASSGLNPESKEFIPQNSRAAEFTSEDYNLGLPEDSFGNAVLHNNQMCYFDASTNTITSYPLMSAQNFTCQQIISFPSQEKMMIETHPLQAPPPFGHFSGQPSDCQSEVQHSSAWNSFPNNYQNGLILNSLTQSGSYSSFATYPTNFNSTVVMNESMHQTFPRFPARRGRGRGFRSYQNSTSSSHHNNFNSSNQHKSSERNYGMLNGPTSFPSSNRPSHMHQARGSKHHQDTSPDISTRSDLSPTTPAFVSHNSSPPSPLKPDTNAQPSLAFDKNHDSTLQKEPLLKLPPDKLEEEKVAETAPATPDTPDLSEDAEVKNSNHPPEAETPRLETVEEPTKSYPENPCEKEKVREPPTQRNNQTNPTPSWRRRPRRDSPSNRRNCSTIEGPSKENIEDLETSNSNRHDFKQEHKSKGPINRQQEDRYEDSSSPHHPHHTRHFYKKSDHSQHPRNSPSRDEDKQGETGKRPERPRNKDNHRQKPNHTQDRRQKFQDNKLTENGQKEFSNFDQSKARHNGNFSHSKEIFVENTHQQRRYENSETNQRQKTYQNPERKQRFQENKQSENCPRHSNDDRIETKDKATLSYSKETVEESRHQQKENDHQQGHKKPKFPNRPSRSGKGPLLPTPESPSSRLPKLSEGSDTTAASPSLEALHAPNIDSTYRRDETRRSERRKPTSRERRKGSNYHENPPHRNHMNSFRNERRTPLTNHDHPSEQTKPQVEREKKLTERNFDSPDKAELYTKFDEDSSIENPSNLNVKDREPNDSISSLNDLNKEQNQNLSLEKSKQYQRKPASLNIPVQERRIQSRLQGRFGTPQKPFPSPKTPRKEVQSEDTFNGNLVYSPTGDTQPLESQASPGCEVLRFVGECTLSKHNDGDSKLFYVPHLFEEEEAMNLFDELKESVQWEDRNVIVNGVERPQPRKVAWFGPLPYSYSSLTLEPHKEMPPTVKLIKERVEMETHHKYNSVLLNFYENGRKSVGWHSDDEFSLGVHPRIASVSLGQVRRFELRPKQAPSNDPKDLAPHYRIYLENGSLILMDGVLQDYWLHRVPKENSIKEARINLTFRNIFPED